MPSAGLGDCGLQGDANQSGSRSSASSIKGRLRAEYGSVSTRRKLRAADRPRAIGAHGLPLCRWCRRLVSPPRYSFCSDDCVHEYRLRSDSTYLRSQVFMRDKGVCRECGTSTMALRRKLDVMSEEMRNAVCDALGIPANRRAPGHSLWDADHVVPVHAGGGCCGLNNIVTLCLPCHLKKHREGATNGRGRAA